MSHPPPVSLSGLLWQLRPSDTEVELLAHTRNVISSELEEETGLETGWIQNGGLFIASNKQRLDEYKRLMSVRHTESAHLFESCSLNKISFVCFLNIKKHLFTNLLVLLNSKKRKNTDIQKHILICILEPDWLLYFVMQ